jgi:DNA-binding CsgD family transcriptional regulator
MTPRQHDVLEQVRKGLSNKEIARVLGISEATVKLHLTVVLRELGLRNRWALIAQHGDQKAIAKPSITNEQILADFTDTVFDTWGARWSDRVLAFGKRVRRSHN